MIPAAGAEDGRTAGGDAGRRQDDLFGMSAPGLRRPAPGWCRTRLRNGTTSKAAGRGKETWDVPDRTPIDFYEPDLKALIGSRIARLSLDNVREIRGRRGGGKKVTVAGMVVAVNRRNTQRGPMARCC